MMQNHSHIPHWRINPIQCLYCYSKSLTAYLDGIRDRLEYVPGEFSFVQCQECGSLHLSPIPPEEQIPMLYPPVYSFRSDFERSTRVKRTLALIEDRLFYRYLLGGAVRVVRNHTDLKGGSMLDIGCGTGSRLQQFSAAGFSVRGLEVQPQLVEYVREKLGFLADLGTLESLAYPSNSFVLVTLFCVLEHLLDIRALLREVYRLLQPGGWMVAEVPLADSLQLQWLKHRWIEIGEAPRHISIPTQQGLRELIGACGFKRFTLCPSSLRMSGCVALSLLPRASTTHSYNTASLFSHLSRFVAGCFTLLYLPVTCIERYRKRPGIAYVLAQKPVIQDS